MSLEYIQNGDCLEVQMVQGPCNEIGTAMLSDFEGLLNQTDWSSINSLILHSGVERGFCAGADLREFYEGLIRTKSEDQDSKMRDFLDRIHHVMDTLDVLPVATIGVLHGPCFGGGFELALTMDIRIAEPSTRFCFPELRLGILPCFGGIPRLRREVGNGVIRDFLLSGRSLNAKRAHELGLVSQLVAPKEGLRAARALSKQISKFDPQARKEAKKFIKELPEAELQKEKDLMMKLFKRKPLKEALKKFVEDEGLQPYLP